MGRFMGWKEQGRAGQAGTASIRLAHTIWPVAQMSGGVSLINSMARSTARLWLVAGSSPALLLSYSPTLLLSYSCCSAPAPALAIAIAVANFRGQKRPLGVN